MKRIYLSTGESVLVDNQDYAYLNQFSWYGKKQHNQIHAYRHVKVGGKDISIRMQRVITEAGPTDRVQFIDRNPLNCTRENLLVTTYNPATKKFEPRVRGVTVEGRNFDRYRARITVQGQKLSLGTFTSPFEAVAAYDAAARKLFGSRAVTNLG